MPELPEVETIARGLARAITGKTIAGTRAFLPKVLLPNASVFSRGVTGRRIREVGRRGKFVVVTLDSDNVVAVHLRMTGRLLTAQPQRTTPRMPYENVRLRFSDGSFLSFVDVRQFGRMVLCDVASLDRALGVEPLSAAFTAEHFRALARGRSTPIKPFLLDQRRIAGIGNIYACEALWEARIPPARPAGGLSAARMLRLHGALRSVLLRAIDMGGTSARDYVNADGEPGLFQNELSIYGRDGEACRRCGARIVRSVIAQRGTWWCPSCQRR